MKYYRQLVRFFVRFENIILALLALAIAFSGGIWYRQYAQNKGDTPSYGGSYTECLTTDQNDWSVISAELTKTGLVTFDDKGEMVNQLISGYQVNAEKTQYIITLAKDIDPASIKESLLNNQTLLGPVGLEDIAPNQIAINLDGPNPNLMFLLARPIFDYGPFKLAKSNDQTTVFVRSSKTGAVPAYLNKIVLEKTDTAEGQKMVAKNKTDGAVIEPTSGICKGFQTKELTYPRYYYLLFNTNTQPFRNKAIRDKVLGKDDLKGISFSLTIPEGDVYKQYSDMLLADWKARNADVTVEVKSNDDIKSKIAPTRQFQAIITGINYGAELDPYYFWHSSQILATGNNFTGFKSEAIDNLIGQLRASSNIVTRYDLIKQIHAEAANQSLGKELGQEKGQYLVSDGIIYKSAWLPLNINDRFQSVSKWSVK